MYSDLNPLVEDFVISGTDIIFADMQYPIPSTDRLMKVSVSGGTPTILANSVPGILKIAVDNMNIYWTSADSVYSIPLNGGEISTLASGLNSPVDLAIDTENVFWTETVCCAHGQTGSIKKVPIIGGVVSVLADGVDAPGALALGMSNVYWTEGGAIGEVEGFGRIAKAPINGGVATTVVSGISSDSSPIAVDNENVYVADSWTIKKVPAGGGLVEKLITDDDSIGDVATDGVNVYWIEKGLSKVRKIPIGGGSVTTLVDGSSGPAEKIDLLNGTIYWMEDSNTIKKVSVDGGPVTTIASSLPFLSDFVVDGTNIYFSEQDIGDIREVSVDGGPISTLWNGSFFYSPYILSVDESNVFWINQNEVDRISKMGGYITVISWPVQSDPYFPGSITVDNSSLYWTEVASGDIKKATPK
jgi:hypothetical protein